MKYSLFHISPLVLCNFLCICHSSLTTIESSTMRKELILSLRPIVEKHFQLNTKNYLWIHYARHSVELKYYFADLVTAILHGPQNAVISIDSINFHEPISFRGFQHRDIIFVDTLASLRFLYKELRKIRTRNFSNLFIFMAHVNDSKHHDLEATFDLLWNLNVLNVNIILQLASDELIMVSYFPFNDGKCQNTKPVVINRYNKQAQRWQVSDYFPPKLKNFKGCKITCATWEDVPFLIIKRDAAGNAVSFWGIEGELLSFMSSNLNFSIGLYLLNASEIKETFNETGIIFKQIFENSADFGLAAFYHRPESGKNAYYSQSGNYFMSHIHIVTNIFNAYSAYEKIAYPFNSTVWITIGVIFVLGCLVIFASRCLKLNWHVFVAGHSNWAPYYNMFVVSLGGNSAVPLPRRNFARFLFAVWLLGTLVLRSAYQSGMYQLLRDNRHRNPPQTIKSVLSDNYAIAMAPENVRYLVSLPEVQTVRFLNVSELQAFPLLAANTNERVAIITPYEYFGYFRLTNVLSRRLHLVRERVFSQQLSMYVRHNSYLVDVLNRQISHAQTYGFTQIWKRRNMLDSNIDVTGSLIEDSSGGGGGGGGGNRSNAKQMQRNILTMNELKAIFFIHCWILAVSFGIFLLELSCREPQRLKNIFKCL